jgi:hypothetical protein
MTATLPTNDMIAGIQSSSAAVPEDHASAPGTATAITTPRSRTRSGTALTAPA